MASNKFVKLGKQASLFHDATSGLKVLPGEKKELKPIHKASSRVVKALRHGHLEYTSAGESSGEEETTSKKSKSTSGDWKEDFEYETSNLKRLSKSELVELAIYNDTEYSENEMNESSFTKADIINEILELIEDEE